MPSYCCVPLCRNRQGGHLFPKQPYLAKEWLLAINRDKWKPTASSIVCRSHFTDQDYKDPAGTLGERRILKHNAVPSVFSWMHPTQPTQRSQRYMQRQQQSEMSCAVTSGNSHSTKWLKRTVVPSIFSWTEPVPVAAVKRIKQVAKKVQRGLQLLPVQTLTKATYKDGASASMTIPSLSCMTNFSHIMFFKCSECAAVFSSAEDLENHTHGEIRSFLCPHCGKQFAEIGELSRHELAHCRGRTKSFQIRETAVHRSEQMHDVVHVEQTDCIKNNEYMHNVVDNEQLPISAHNNCIQPIPTPSSVLTWRCPTCLHSSFTDMLDYRRHFAAHSAPERRSEVDADICGNSKRYKNYVTNEAEDDYLIGGNIRIKLEKDDEYQQMSMVIEQEERYEEMAICDRGEIKQENNEEEENGILSGECIEIKQEMFGEVQLVGGLLCAEIKPENNDEMQVKLENDTMESKKTEREEFGYAELKSQKKMKSILKINRLKSGLKNTANKKTKKKRGRPKKKTYELENTIKRTTNKKRGRPKKKTYELENTIKRTTNRKRGRPKKERSDLENRTENMTKTPQNPSTKQNCIGCSIKHTAASNTKTSIKQNCNVKQVARKLMRSGNPIRRTEKMPIIVYRQILQKPMMTQIQQNGTGCDIEQSTANKAKSTIKQNCNAMQVTRKLMRKANPKMRAEQIHSIKHGQPLPKHLPKRLTHLTWRCPTCLQASFADMSEFRLHVASHSRTDDKCSECGKTFTTATQLQCHVCPLKSEKLFTCLQCDKAFLCMNELQDHLLHATHSAIKTKTSYSYIGNSNVAEPNYHSPSNASSTIIVTIRKAEPLPQATQQCL